MPGERRAQPPRWPFSEHAGAFRFVFQRHALSGIMRASQLREQTENISSVACIREARPPQFAAIAKHVVMPAKDEIGKIAVAEP